MRRSYAYKDNSTGPIVGGESLSGWQEYGYFALSASHSTGSQSIRLYQGVFVTVFNDDTMKFCILKAGTIKPGTGKAKHKTRRVLLVKHVMHPASVWCGFVPLSHVAIVKPTKDEIKAASNPQAMVLDTPTVTAFLQNRNQRLHSLLLLSDMYYIVHLDS
jgi:hypothetical protein